jgi:hypothetical protein
MSFLIFSDSGPAIAVSFKNFFFEGQDSSWDRFSRFLRGLPQTARGLFRSGMVVPECLLYVQDMVFHLRRGFALVPLLNALVDADVEF